MCHLLKQFLLAMQFGLRDSNVGTRGNGSFERKKMYEKEKELDNHPFLKTVGLLHCSHEWYTGHSKTTTTGSCTSSFLPEWHSLGLCRVTSFWIENLMQVYTIDPGRADTSIISIIKDSVQLFLWA